MTLRQRMMRWSYPIVMRLGKFFSNKPAFSTNTKQVPSAVPFHQLQVELINGQVQTMLPFKGKKVLLVNTASDCGFTPQLEQLQTLHNQYSGQLVVIGFPSNDFKEQEKGSDEAIASFCSLNYGVSFLLAKKSAVLKNDQQNKVFSWLTNKHQNGWNNHPPSWNFTKYLVNEQGLLTHVFSPMVSPLAKEVASNL